MFVAYNSMWGEQSPQVAGATAQQAASLADLQKLIAHEAERAHSGRKGAYLTTVLLMPSQVVISPRKSFIADTEEEACT